MNVVSIILMVALGIFAVWLVVDTVIYVVKKTKERKLKKQIKQDNTTSE